jgi:hypothetical protein
MINPTNADIGRKVIYRERIQHHNGVTTEQTEEGVITSINANFVFVNYGHTSWGIATLREELEWSGA